ncbi:F-box/kelch-repeat protein At3g23880-like [Nicotiana tabacum]|uniref:F-box/kelch-repeat protein At3g23880-like n=1 Tax=Nicotiana tabacum TaxID=4097 RepID=A0AC58TQE1_TOBAC
MGSRIEEEILRRLPVKSLLRFKCVSESWKTLISEPHFKKKHLNHAKNQNPPKMLIGQTCPKDDTFYFYSSSLSSHRIVEDVRNLDCPSNFVPGFCKIYCCCDGLFLIGIDNTPNSSILLLWNPLTRESIVLPDQNENSNYSIYGLGYDPTSDDYKVLKVEDDEDYEDDDDCEISNEILSLKSGSWRKISDSNDKDYNCLSSADSMDCLAFVHGAFHWHGFTERNGFLFSVISFNISNEQYGEIPLPERMCLPSNMIDHGVAVLGGMLSINCVYCNGTNFFDLWVMKDYGVEESWIKLFTITNARIPSIIPIVPKYMFADGEVLFSCGRRTEFMTSKGPYGFSNLIWSLASGDIDTCGYVYTESLIFPEVNL